MLFVTLQQARDHIRSDTDADDADLELKIAAASEAVMGYIETTDTGDWGDSSGAPIVDSGGFALNVPAQIQNATLMMVGYLYRERDGSNEYETPIAGFYLPAGVTAMLYRFRTPTAL
jgi:hypothetical protein